MPVAAGAAAAGAGEAAGGSALLANAARFGSQALKFQGAKSVISGSPGNPGQPGAPDQVQQKTDPAAATKSASSTYSNLLQAGQFH